MINFFRRLLQPPYHSYSVLILFILLSIGMTHPSVFHMWDSIPGDLGDPLLNVWILDRNFYNILNFELEGFWEANIFYPAPLVLAYSEHLFAETLFGLPIYLRSCVFLLWLLALA